MSDILQLLILFCRILLLLFLDSPPPPPITFLMAHPYLFVPKFTSPATTFTWTFDGKRQNLPFCCFVRKDILKEVKKRYWTLAISKRARDWVHTYFLLQRIFNIDWMWSNISTVIRDSDDVLRVKLSTGCWIGNWDYDTFRYSLPVLTKHSFLHISRCF